MLKTLKLSVVAIMACTALYAQQVKEPAQKKGHKQVEGQRPPPEPRPPLPQVDTTQMPVQHAKQKWWSHINNNIRDTLIKGLTTRTTLPNHIFVASHRAQMVGGTDPENSMAAIQKLVSPAVLTDIVELDIKKSSDNFVYVMHDNYLQRTTDFLDKFPGAGQGSDGYGHYNNYTWAQVSTLTLKRADFTYTDQKVPLFRDVLRYIKGSTHILINLDIGDMAVFRETWNVVAQEDAFDVCIFKTAQLTVEQYKQQYYDPLPESQKAKVIFFPMIVPTPAGYASPMAQYNAWENSGLARGYEIGYRKAGAGETDLLDVIDAINIKNRVRVHVFSTLPDNYQGRYLGNVNINQCCNDVYDSRGDWQYLLYPRPSTKGLTGYIITDDPVSADDWFNF